MAIKRLKLKESINKAVQAIMPQEEAKRSFEQGLVAYMTTLREHYAETEENQKNILRDFLKDYVFKSGNYINTYGRDDLVIFNGKTAESTIGVLIETKSTTNDAEMMTSENLNTKAFQEVISYYLKERLDNNNIEIKRCIVTNGLSWFVISSEQIEKFFIKKNKLIKLYRSWQKGQLASSSTDFLYKNVVSPAIEEAMNAGIAITHFNLIDAQKAKRQNNIQLKTTNVTQLYRFFTPENLLNQEVFTDSNRLNKRFYDELLYIMGLQDVISEKKHIITRFDKSNRQEGSLIESTIQALDLRDVPVEKQFDNAISLSVVWINRILFLKLLESQLISFNGNDDGYSFLNTDKIKSFDDLNALFFGILAKQRTERNEKLSNKYPHVPYLNSSLFELDRLEKSSLGTSISGLNEMDIEYYNKTVLKNSNRKRKTGKTKLLKYLFDFLNAYDFTTSIQNKQHDQSTLINASVLGLIFEKINGYKDGSFFTPGTTTMFMSRRLVRQTITKKVNEIKGWSCHSFEDISTNINVRDGVEAFKELSDIIDKIKICDPAVGSGHFLVSVLNEIIAAKVELGCLMNRDGSVLNKVQCRVVNDELIFQDINGDNILYKRGDAFSTKIQKVIFHEKRKCIENCLFGVDINPNSVNICRLRLWIELLKNSYYKVEDGIEELTTLPNIDINIKIGDSLLHNIPLDTSIDGDSLIDKRFDVIHLNDYYEKVFKYKNTHDKRIKADLTNEISRIKSRIYTSFDIPERKEWKKYQRQLAKAGTIDIFEDSNPKTLKKQQERIENLKVKERQAWEKWQNQVNKPIFNSGLEWRMEFPEVLDGDGDFKGFDAIIMNPPYIYSRVGSPFTDSQKEYFSREYDLNDYQANTFGLFLNLAFKLLNNNGIFSMIIPNSFMTVKQYGGLRRYLLKNTGDLFILNSKDRIFPDASVDNCIISSVLKKPTKVKMVELHKGIMSTPIVIAPKDLLSKSVFSISAFKTDSKVIDTMNENGKMLDTVAHIYDGLKVFEGGKGDPEQPINVENDRALDRFKTNNDFFSTSKKDKNYFPFLDMIHRYGDNWDGRYLRYGSHLAAKRKIENFMGPRLLIRQVLATDNYPFVITYVKDTILNEQKFKIISRIRVDPLFLLAVLESKVESYYGLTKFDFLQRSTFPAMRNYQIKQLIVPKVSEKEQRELGEMATRMLHAVKSNLREDIINLNDEIDEKVMDYFLLSEDQKQKVRDFDIDD
ncbi:type IIG restriction enzyme/methyltransferase [Levilactobacillus humaensis]|uniref:type IIG restriction enzyme/methyltransferase n=1 Tax=Levilactobacillus humaensis TaxID=2950375 RepID=UPI0021C40877|nr:Eco57I restriction-modification methylase domain-containing protein [Levilactobacillus humaensis]